MKTGKSLVELAQELERQKAAKRDFVAPTKALTLSRSDASPTGNGFDLQIEGQGNFLVGKTTHRQVGDRLGIPAKYYDKMASESPELLCENVNHWLHSGSDARMVRTLDGRARAFLSDRFSLDMDHADIVEVALPAIQQAGAVVESCEITEKRLYLKAVVPDCKEEIPPAGVTDWSWGKDHHAIDVVQPGIVISNSEIGFGSMSVQPAIHTVKCSNLAVFRSEAMRKYHIGKSLNTGQQEAAEYLRDDTRRVTKAALMMQVRDLITAALTGDVFEKLVNGLKEARGQKIEGNPAEGVKELAKMARFSEAEEGGVLRHLIEGGELSQYGLHNAVTRYAQDVGDYDRASELEQAGADVLVLSRKDWRTIAEAA